MSRLIRLRPVFRLEDLTESIVRSFLQRGASVFRWSAHTSFSHHKNLRAFLRWCVERGYAHRNPLDFVPQPVVLKSLPNFYSEAEVEQMLRQIDRSFSGEFERQRNRAIIGTMLLAGLRKGETIGLRITDVDFKDCVIRVRAETAKNRLPRVVHLNSALLGLLTTYERLCHTRRGTAEDFWLSWRQRRRFTAHGLKHLFDRLSAELGWPVRAHKMRHTFATRFYQGSRDIVALQRLLGHADLNTTMIYTHLVPEATAVSLEQNPMTVLF